MSMNAQIKLKPLPKLPILRDDYISQGQVDEIVDCLEKHHTELLRKAVENEYPNRVDLHSETHAEIVEAIKEGLKGKAVLPDSQLGFIDFAFELSRRIRKAYEMSDIKYQGQPLAESPDGPFPQLIDLEVQSRTIENGHLTQGLADEMLLKFYTHYPELAFLEAESLRAGEYWLGAFWKIQEKFQELTDKELGRIEKSRLATELRRRLSKMCGLYCFGVTGDES